MPSFTERTKELLRDAEALIEKDAPLGAHWGSWRAHDWLYRYRQFLRDLERAQAIKKERNRANDPVSPLPGSTPGE